MCVCVRGTNKSSHLNILSAVFGSYVTTFMQIQPFYMTIMYGEFGTAPFEGTLKVGLPKGVRVSSCVNVRLFALAFLYVCVCPVFVALSPGTSAMPQLSQFLTSLLKNMLIQTNLLFLLCSSHPPCSSWDGLEETYNHSRRSSPTAWVFDFPLPSFFSPLYFTIPNHLFPQMISTRNDEKACQWETAGVCRVSCGLFELVNCT